MQRHQRDLAVINNTYGYINSGIRSVLVDYWKNIFIWMVTELHVKSLVLIKKKYEHWIRTLRMHH